MNRDNSTLSFLRPSRTIREKESSSRTRPILDVLFRRRSHKGHTSLRFTDYVPQNKRNIDEIESDLETNLAEIELIDIEKDKILYPKELEMVLNKKELLELEEAHFRNKTIKEDEYLYYDNEKNIRIGIIDFEKEEILEIEDLTTNVSKISYQKGLKEQGEGSSTTDYTLWQQPVPTRQKIYTQGNIPKIPYTDYRDSKDKYISKGKRQPLEQPIKFQVKVEPQILNLPAHDPQSWTNIIDVWKSTIIRDYYRLIQSMEPEEMYKYLETFLGESVKVTWESYKTTYNTEFNTMLSLGSNPYNFVNKIQSIVTGQDPNSRHLGVLEDAIRQLEQLSLYKWKYIKKFLNDYFYYTCISGNCYNQDIGERLFKKLPGALGIEIAERWKQQPQVVDNPNALFTIGYRIQHVIKVLKEKCISIQIQKQLKNDDYGYC